MRQQEVFGTQQTRAKGTMQEALGFLSGDRRMDREDLVPLAEGANQEEFGIEPRKGDEAVSSATARSPLL
jgi:uncharacterized protein YjbJ (UPF0337 family)